MKITLTGLVATGFHGVLANERRDGQTFVADVTLSLPEPAGDDIGATVDYSAVASFVTAEMAGAPVALIETLAARIADGIMVRWPRVRAVAVTVHKPQAPLAVPFGDVTCTVRRRREAPRTSRHFVLSLGANLGDVTATLRGAVDALAATPGVTVTAVSGVYRTAPVETSEPQPDYHNLVVTGDTTLGPSALLRRTSAIEQQFGRKRTHRHAARTLDIDLIKVGKVRRDTPKLTLPHPRAHKRAFVLIPWQEIEPKAKLPEGNIATLIRDLDESRVRREGSL